MPTQLMNVTVATTCFPKDGNGGATTLYPTPKLSTGAEVFTATSLAGTWGAGAGPSETNTAVAGDYVTTSDGCWGVATGGFTTTAANVDFWRSEGQVNRGSVPCIPLAGSTIRIYSGKCHLVGSRRPRILRIITTKQTAADTLIITDAVGATVYTYTAANTLAVPNPIDFTNGQGQGRDTVGPFGIKLSATTTAAVVEYEP